MKNKLTSESGITLISLIVTVIVLIVLSTISMNAMFGEQGMLNTSMRIKKRHDNATSTEESHTERVLAEYEYAKDKWTLTKDDNGMPIVVRGDVILKVGDYINYYPTAELEEDAVIYYKSEQTKNGHSDQEFYLKGEKVSYDTKQYGWRILGADDEGQLLIISEDVVQPVTGGNIDDENGKTYYALSGKDGYANGINELNKISALYGQGKYATGARSINISDINTITGYDPKNREYGAGTLGAYGNQVTYTRVDESTISSSGNNGAIGRDTYDKFTYYKNNVWKILEIGESINVQSTYYEYYPNTLTSNNTGTTSGIATDSQAYNMLFLKEYWLRVNL